MREIRQSGSEGGGTEFNRFSLPLSKFGSVLRTSSAELSRFERGYSAAP
jgi:hypothetical protein